MEDNQPLLSQKINSADSRQVVDKSPSKAIVSYNCRTLYYTVFPGNGPQVIRDAMARRSNGKVQWKEVSKDAMMWTPDQIVNFIWKPTNYNFKMYSIIDKILSQSFNYSTAVAERQLCVNHLENIRGICTKTGLVRTLK